MMSELKYKAMMVELMSIYPNIESWEEFLKSYSQDFDDQVQRMPDVDKIYLHFAQALTYHSQLE